MSSDPVLDQFKQCSQEEGDKTLAAVKSPMTLYLCPSCLVKACSDEVLLPLRDVINLSLTSGTFSGCLKEKEETFQKPSLDPTSIPG